MNASLAPLVLAAVDAVESYRRGMYGPPADSPGMLKPLLIGGSIIAVLWGGAYSIDRLLKSRREAAKPDRSLFGDLASAHGLTAQERQHLEALANQSQVEPPAAIFVRPELVAPLTRSSQKAELWQSVARKVFGLKTADSASPA